MCRYIELHSQEADLSAAHLVRFFGVSRSEVYRLFAPFNGVATYIRERRLARAHEAILRAPGKVSISRVAEINGFSDASHFTRSFRAQFGYTPLDLRLGRYAQSHVVAKFQTGATSDFEAWIRAMRD